MTITVSNASVSAAVPFPAFSESRATYRLEANGDINKIINGTTTKIGEWLSPKSGMSGYECRFTNLSGTPPVGTLGSWLDMTSGHDIYLLDSTTAGSLMVSTNKAEVREKANHANIDDGTITLIAYLSH